MKIRNGFVSNSSSSSFLIYGAHLEGVDEESLPQDLLGLESFYGGDYSDGVYLGKSWDSIGDEETGKEFKDGIEKSLTKILPDQELSFQTHEECSYDG